MSVQYQCDFVPRVGTIGFVGRLIGPRRFSDRPIVVDLGTEPSLSAWISSRSDLEIEVLGTVRVDRVIQAKGGSTVEVTPLLGSAARNVLVNARWTNVASSVA